MSQIRWGIVGAGGIAQKFARDLAVARGGVVHAIAGRDLTRAREWAQALGASLAYDSVRDLAEEKSVDIVYIATPHQAHYEAAKTLLSCGKPVLVEKPMTVNSAQARELIELARAKNLFLMEALWTRFLPLYRRLRRLLDEGGIGPVRAVSSSFCVRADHDAKKRWMNPDLAGGSLLDLGVYCLAMTQLVLRTRPSAVSAVAVMSSTGVDEMLSAALSYPCGAVANMVCGLAAHGDNRLVIAGEKGTVEVPSNFIAAQKAVIVCRDGKTSMEEPFRGEGFEFQIAETVRCLRAGETESPLMPLTDTLELAESMDEIRRQIGLRYPFE